MLDFARGRRDLPHRPHRSSPGAPRSRGWSGSRTAGTRADRRPREGDRGRGRPHPRPRLRRLHALGGPAAGPVRRVPEGRAQGAPQDPGRRSSTSTSTSGCSSIVNREASAARTRGRLHAAPARDRLRERPPQEALEQKQAELKSAQGCAEAGRGKPSGPRRAAALAQQARAHKKEQARLAKDHADESKRLDAANATLDGAGQARKALDSDLDKLNAHKDAHVYDEGRHHTLVHGARPLAEQLVSRAAERAAPRRAPPTEGEPDERDDGVAPEEKCAPGPRDGGSAGEGGETAARAEKEEAHRRARSGPRPPPRPEARASRARSAPSP